MKPIYITGLMKSGTTLVSNLLDGHPDLKVFPHEHHFHLLFQRIYPSLEVMKANWLYSTTSLMLLNKYVDTGKFNIQSFRTNLASTPLCHKKKIKEDDPMLQTYYENLERDIVRKAKSAKDIIDITVDSFPHEGNPKYWAWKNVHDTYSHEQISGFCALYPDTKVIFVIRDPRGLWKSRRDYRRRYQKCHGFARYLRDLALFYYNHEMLGKLMEQHLPNVMFVQYENIALQPKRTMEYICKFLDIKYDDILLKPTRYGKPIHVSTATNNKGDSIYSNSVYAWTKKGFIERYILECLTEDFLNKNYDFTRKRLLSKHIKFIISLVLGLVFKNRVRHY